MMKKLSLFLIVVISISVFQACTRDGKLAMGNKSAAEHQESLALVPSTANSVTTFNMQSLMDKMDFEAVKEMEFYRDMMTRAKEERPEMVYLMEDPSESGIDLSKNIYTFTDLGDEADMVNGTIFSISDETKFVEMIKKGDRSGQLIIEEENGSQVARIGNQTAIAWNDGKAVAVTGQFDFDLTLDGDDDEGTFDKASQKALDLLQNKPANSISSNKQFSKDFKGNHDFFTYQNTSFLTNLIDDRAEMLMSGFDISEEDLKDNYTVSYADFKDGKVEANQEYKFNPKVKELLKAIVKEDVKTSFTDYIPAENLVGVFTGGLNMKGINTLVQEQVGPILDMSMNGVGLTREDIMKAIDGDLFVAGYAVEGSDEPQMLVGLKIGDQSTFDKVMEAGKKNKMLREGDNKTFEVKIPFSKTNYTVTIKGDMLLIGESDMVAKVAKGGFKKAKAKDLNSGTFGMYAQTRALQNIFPNLQLGNEGEIRMTGDLEGSNTSLNFDKDNGNSLKLLMQMINEGYKASEKKEKSSDTEVDF